MISSFIPQFSFKTASDKSLSKSLHSITGYFPKNLELYKQAFMHSSKGLKKLNVSYNNERLEFLGDSILGAIISDYLFKKFPNKDEGFLTQLRSRIVNRQHLHHLALKLGLNEILTTNLSKTDKLMSSAYGDAFEALIGAVYLDLGYIKTHDFIVLKLLALHIDIDELINSDSDFKSQLQIYCQKNKLNISYNFEEGVTAKGLKYFKVNASVNDKIYGSFEHASKKVAEQKAAQIAMEEIQNG